MKTWKKQNETKELKHVCVCVCVQNYKNVIQTKFSAVWSRRGCNAKLGSKFVKNKTSAKQRIFQKQLEALENTTTW